MLKLINILFPTDFSQNANQALRYLIAMATHGLSGLEKLLIGSTTEKVVRKSDVPVLTVK